MYMGNNIDVGNKLYSSLNQVLSSLRKLAETVIGILSEVKTQTNPGF